MKIKRMSLAVAALGLAVLLLPGVPACAETLLLSTTEIRDPMMNNAVAARVVVPQGWTLAEQQIPWNLDLYGDPSKIVFGLKGPADEVEFAAISRMRFNFDQSWLAMMDHMHNETIRQANELCRMAQYTPNIAQRLCAQAYADMQPRLQEIQRNKEALLSGKLVENGLPIRQPMWAADIARWLLGNDSEVTDIQVKKVERPADLTALLQKAVTEADAEVRQMAAQLNIPFKGLSFDVARLHVGFAKKGKRYDGIALAITRYITLVNNQRMPALPGQTGPDPFYGKEYVIWDVYLNGASALAGRLEAYEEELTAIVANTTVDPLWQAAVDNFSMELSRRIAEAKREGQMAQWKSQMAHQEKMQAMRNETFNYVSQRRQEVFARRSESLSNAATGWTDVLTDRQRWQSGGTKYVAPNNYKYAWEGAGNKVVFSNDSGFNPNHSSSLSGNWKEMRQVPW